MCDSHMTGRVEVGVIRIPLSELPTEASVSGRWLKLQVGGVRKVAGRWREGGGRLRVFPDPPPDANRCQQFNSPSPRPPPLPQPPQGSSLASASFGTSGEPEGGEVLIDITYRVRGAVGVGGISAEPQGATSCVTHLLH